MNNEVTKAMILAAGEGTRLRPLTVTMPKVLLPVGGVPLICHTLAWLKNQGISKVAINTHYQGSKIVDLLGNGSEFGLEITYSHEETPLGTAGGVKKIEHFFDGAFIVVYGDIMTNFDLKAMIRFHKANKSEATLALVRVTDPKGWGMVETDINGRILKFIEKPPAGTLTGGLGNGAIYVIEKRVLSYIPVNKFFDFGFDVFPLLLATDLPIYGYTLTSDDYLIDIGTIERYRQANEDIMRIKKLRE
jgi:NDP-sugar pyrophosphorylase family protein